MNSNSLEQKWHHELSCDAVCCSVLQCAAECCSHKKRKWVSRILMCCSALQRVAVCCSVLQSVAACCSPLHSQEIEIASRILLKRRLASLDECSRAPSCALIRLHTHTHHTHTHIHWYQHFSQSLHHHYCRAALMDCSVVQCSAVCCNVLNCVAVCCIALQYVAV